MARKPKRSEAQKRADEKYSETNREKNLKNQKTKYANLAATFPKGEKTSIQKTLKRHGVTVANALRAVAAMLERGETLPPITAKPTTANNTNGTASDDNQ